MVIGTPGFVLVPARNHEWEVVTDNVVIPLPKAGVISELMKSDFLAGSARIPGEDEFYVFEDLILYAYQIPRVLFALGKYPQMEDNQAFNVYAVDFSQDTVLIHGALIEFK